MRRPGRDSESSSESATGAPSAAPEDADVAADDAAASAGGGNSGESALAVDTRAVAAAREIVRTGSMQLSVDDAEDGAAAVARIAGDAGGFVADEQARVRDHEVDITVRVPADTFEDVRGEIAGLGDVVEQTVEAQDVTAEVVDLDSRDHVARAQRRTAAGPAVGGGRRGSAGDGGG